MFLISFNNNSLKDIRFSACGQVLGTMTGNYDCPEAISLHGSGFLAALTLPKQKDCVKAVEIS
jgi:hypothetical protein